MVVMWETRAGRNFPGLDPSLCGRSPVSQRLSLGGTRAVGRHTPFGVRKLRDARLVWDSELPGMMAGGANPQLMRGAPSNCGDLFYAGGGDSVSTLLNLSCCFAFTPCSSSSTSCADRNKVK